MKTKMVHKSEVKIGDTVIHRGYIRTVNANTFSKDEFMGLLLWGDSYRLGQEMVEVIIDVKF